MAALINNIQTVLQLFPDASLGTLTLGIEKAIQNSYGEQSVRNPTRAEVQQRFDICLKWACTLRGDLEWGVQRIVGAMPDILRTELSGQRWEPSDRMCWVPSDGR